MRDQRPGEVWEPGGRRTFSRSGEGGPSKSGRPEVKRLVASRCPGGGGGASATMKAHREEMSAVSLRRKSTEM